MRPPISALTLGLAALISSQQIPTIRVPVRLVTLPTLVFSRDSRILPGLQVADFRVLDNGRPQTVTLDTSSTPASIVLAIQVSQDVRQYVPFIARAGSALDALLVGESGEAAVVTYGSGAPAANPFEGGYFQPPLRPFAASGGPAGMIDAGMRALTLLAK